MLNENLYLHILNTEYGVEDEVSSELSLNTMLFDSDFYVGEYSYAALCLTPKADEYFVEMLETLQGQGADELQAHLHVFYTHEGTPLRVWQHISDKELSLIEFFAGKICKEQQLDEQYMLIVENAEFDTWRSGDYVSNPFNLS
jgi:hypothetical protein